MIGFDVKKLFFDRAAVTSRVDQASRRVLSRFGAFVRRTAKGSIKKRKAASRPGTPPSSHTGLLKRFIFFAYEPALRSVVIGPMRLNQRNRGDAPSLLEYGGRTTLVRRDKELRRTYRPRPYMGPAFEKERPKLPDMWRGSIK